MKFSLRREKGELLRKRESDRSRRAHPRRRCFVDRAALRLSEAAPRIAVGGVQPTAAEIDGECRLLRRGPCPSAKPRPGLKEETLDLRVRDPPRRGNPSRTAADDNDLCIAAARHVVSVALGMKEDFKRTCPLARSKLQIVALRSEPNSPAASALLAGDRWNVRAPLHVVDMQRKRENQAVRVAVPLIAAFVMVAGADMSVAQPTNPSPGEAATCPPDATGDPPTVGGRSSERLSDKLAQSKGVICPPAGVDRDMQVRPPSGGQLKVIPPPGSPGGDPNVQPK
jgi:hypothetical protein